MHLRLEKGYATNIDSRPASIQERLAVSLRGALDLVLQSESVVRAKRQFGSPVERAGGRTAVIHEKLTSKYGPSNEIVNSVPP